MEDAPLANRGPQDPQQAPPIAKGLSAMAAPTQPPIASSAPTQLPREPPNNAFVSQFDMTQPLANWRSSFNMNTMATALPHVSYGAPYGPGAQPQQGAYLGVTPQVPAQMVQFQQHGFHGVPALAPDHYAQQHLPIQPYYTMPMYHGNQPTEADHGTIQGTVYAQSQVPPNTHPHPHGARAPPPFHYYPTSPPFAAPARLQPHLSNLPASAPRKHVDPGTAPPPIVTGSSGPGIGHVDGRPPKPNTKVEESGPAGGNQGIVRGPPRKPKQRGWYRRL